MKKERLGMLLEESTFYNKETILEVGWSSIVTTQGTCFYPSSVESSPFPKAGSYSNHLLRTQ